MTDDEKKDIIVNELSNMLSAYSKDVQRLCVETESDNPDIVHELSTIIKDREAINRVLNIFYD